MRCPKCKFISFDDLSSCAKCSNDLSALSQDLAGTCADGRVPFFLSSVVQAPEYEEDSFSDSQALPPIDDTDINLDDTGTGQFGIADASIEVSGDDVALELGDVMPVDMDQIDLGDSLDFDSSEAMDLDDPADRDLTAKRIIAKMPIMAAHCYKHSMGHPFVYSRDDLGYVENFLNMMFSVPMRDYEPEPIAVKALDLMLILHADHEQNASTSTVRLAGSAEANPFHQ